MYSVHVQYILTATAESLGKRFLYRTGAAFVSARLGIRSKPPISAAELRLPIPRQTGGLIVAGSYVTKTTAQLQALIARRGDKLAVLEINVQDLVREDSKGRHAAEIVEKVVQQAESHLRAGRDTLVMTSRKLITGHDGLSSLAVGTKVAEALVSVMRKIEVRPRYIIAKVRIHTSTYRSIPMDQLPHPYLGLLTRVWRKQGGITSSDAATKGLNIKRALVVGQAAPGVPLWRCDEPTSRHVGVPYVVFPGNVGGENTLAELVEAWY